MAFFLGFVCGCMAVVGLQVCSALLDEYMAPRLSEQERREIQRGSDRYESYEVNDA